LSLLSKESYVKIEPLSFDQKNTNFSQANQTVQCMDYEEVMKPKKPDQSDIPHLAEENDN